MAKNPYRATEPSLPEGVSVTYEQSVQSQYLDANGHELPNPVPMQPPVGYVKRPSIAQQMREMIQQVSYEAAMSGQETEEEANDFDVDEDFEPSSPWEDEFEVDPTMEAMLALQSKPPVKAEPKTSGASAPAPTGAVEGASSAPSQKA